jgi:hypothetical protein
LSTASGVGGTATTPPMPQPGTSPAPGSGAQKFQIPGSALSLPVPTGFTLGADEHGPVLTNGSAVIRAKRDERPFKTAMIDYSAENLMKSGFTLSEKQDLGQFSIVRAAHSASKKNFVFALVPDSETSVLVISASFAPEDEARLAPAIMSAAAGLQVGK